MMYMSSGVFDPLRESPAQELLSSNEPSGRSPSNSTPAPSELASGSVAGAPLDSLVDAAHPTSARPSAATKSAGHVLPQGPPRMGRILGGPGNFVETEPAWAYRQASPTTRSATLRDGPPGVGRGVVASSMRSPTTS